MRFECPAIRPFDLGGRTACAVLEDAARDLRAVIDYYDRRYHIGYTEQELLSRSFADITHPDDLDGDLEQMQALLAGAIEVYETEKRYLHREGHVVWVQIGVSAVRSDDGEVEYLISQLHDITERRRVEDELAHQALHDPLTGLPNRALFLDRLRHAIVRMRRHTGQAAVLFVDLDRFKLVNDTLGHKAGDVVLAPNGSQYQWSSDTAKKFFVAFDRLDTAAGPTPTASAR